MIIKEQCLWVSYAAMTSAAPMPMQSDGFFTGQFPVTAEIMRTIKGEIAASVQEHLDKMTAVDKKGMPIINAPKPQVVMVIITGMAPAERDKDIGEIN